jgi:hypothetical protein
VSDRVERSGVGWAEHHASELIAEPVTEEDLDGPREKALADIRAAKLARAIAATRGSPPRLSHGVPPPAPRVRTGVSADGCEWPVGSQSLACSGVILWRDWRLWQLR